MSTLVINLTRFGDLLQTQPVLSGLRARGEAVGLVCLDNFAAAADLLRDVDHVHPLPGARLMAELDRDWRGAVRELDQWTRDLADDFPPSSAVNLTPSLSARLLAGRFGASTRGGFLLDEYGFGVNSGPWASFLQLASGRRGLSPFNVADLFRKAAGLDAPCPFALRDPSAEERDAARRMLAEAHPGPAPEKGFVAFQLGASENRRRWPVEYFARLGEILSREGFGLALLGTRSESPLAERFSLTGPPHADLTGRTSLPGLAAVLSECRLLATNDTGTMHLAAGLGVPVAAVFLATAQPWDTGPYAPDCLCLEPDLDCHPCGFGKPCEQGEACRRAVTPESTGRLILPFLETGHWPLDAATEGTRAWITRRDDEGFMTLESLSGHGSGDRARWMAVQRLFYRRFLDGREPPDNPPPHGLSPNTAHSIGQALAEASDLIDLIEKQAALLGVRPRDQLKAKFLAYCQRFAARLESDPHLAVLGALWTFESRDQGGGMDTFAALARRYAGLLQTLRAHLA